MFNKSLLKKNKETIESQKVYIKMLQDTIEAFKKREIEIEKRIKLGTIYNNCQTRKSTSCYLEIKKAKLINQIEDYYYPKPKYTYEKS
tara:strand:- start:383 stop:646 length:264 start_codon:yes stop_codon:yes gene_type:complete